MTTLELEATGGYFCGLVEHSGSHPHPGLRDLRINIESFQPGKQRRKYKASQIFFSLKYEKINDVKLVYP